VHSVGTRTHSTRSRTRTHTLVSDDALARLIRPHDLHHGMSVGGVVVVVFAALAQVEVRTHCALVARPGDGEAQAAVAAHAPVDGSRGSSSSSSSGSGGGSGVAGGTRSSGSSGSSVGGDGGGEVIIGGGARLLAQHRGRSVLGVVDFDHGVGLGGGPLARGAEVEICSGGALEAGPGDGQHAAAVAGHASVLDRERTPTTHTTTTHASHTTTHTARTAHRPAHAPSRSEAIDEALRGHLGSVHLQLRQGQMDT